MHDTLNDRLAKFEQTLNRLSANKQTPTEGEWDALWLEQNDIVQDFKTIKYPTREEKDAAWQVFSDLREAFKVLHNDFSARHLTELAAGLNATQYVAAKDRFLENPTFESLKSACETVKERQKAFAGVIENFKTVKYIMTKDDKTALMQIMDAARATHQTFWDAQQGVFQDLRAVKDKEYAEKHNEYLRKQAQFKTRVEQNIQHNKERLMKANNYKLNLEDQLAKHNERLKEDIGDIFKTRVEGWITETNTKLNDVNLQIQKLETYIDEDNAKLAELQARNEA